QQLDHLRRARSFSVGGEVLLEPDPPGPGGSVAGFVASRSPLLSRPDVALERDCLDAHRGCKCAAGGPALAGDWAAHDWRRLCLELLTRGSRRAGPETVPRAGPKPEWTARSGDQRPGLPQPDR